MSTTDRRRVYGVELRLPGNKRGVYVGQTGVDPQERLEVHLSGSRYGSGIVQRYGTKIAFVLPAVHGIQAAEALERATARKLRKQGVVVKGGH